MLLERKRFRENLDRLRVCKMSSPIRLAVGIMDDVREEEDEGLFDSPTSSSDGDSTSSIPSDFMEDASSNSSSSSSPPQNSLASSTQLGGGPLYKMSNLMVHLPFKRGLSKHYDGKSQSFTSLAQVSCLADLGKAENRYNRRRWKSSSRSYGRNLDSHRSYPPARSSISKAISKKSSPRGSCAASLIRRNGMIICSTLPATIPTQKHV